MLAIVIGGIPRRTDRESIRELGDQLQTTISQIAELKLLPENVPLARLDPVVEKELEGIFVVVVHNQTDPTLFPTVALKIGETINNWFVRLGMGIRRQRKFIRVGFRPLYSDETNTTYQKNLAAPR